MILWLQQANALPCHAIVREYITGAASAALALVVRNGASGLTEGT